MYDWRLEWGEERDLFRNRVKYLPEGFSFMIRFDRDDSQKEVLPVSFCPYGLNKMSNFWYVSFE